MLVSRAMSRKLITTTPETPVAEAQSQMRREKIHHLPVVDNSGKLVGIVTEKDLIYASPSPATSLSMYEINYLLAKLRVAKVMTREVITATEDSPLEQAARVMADHDIGCLPVVTDGKPVGIVTESDIFRVFVDTFAARRKGVRIEAVVPDVRGELARLSGAIAGIGGNILAFGSLPGDEPTAVLVTIKVDGVPRDKLLETIKPFVERVVDVREG
jgi:acetoin utilization protein AcuB